MFALTRSVPRMAIAILFISLALAQEKALSHCEDARVDDPANSGLQQFGAQVAIHNGYAVVGNPLVNSLKGAAYVFRRSGANWIQEATLQGSDTTWFDFFGTSVAIHNDRIIVGAVKDQVRPGAAYVFKRNGTTWTQEAKLVSGGTEELSFFGQHVAIDGTYVLVSDPYDDESAPDGGAVFVFRRNGTTWVQQDKLMKSNPDATDQLGRGVGISGEFVVVGVPFENDTPSGDFQGAAYIFRRNDNGTPSNLGDDFWTQMQRLTANDAELSDGFAKCVAINGNVVAVGAEFKNAAYVFRFNGANWGQEAKLVPNDPVSGGEFGISVAIEGNQVVVGARNADRETPQHMDGVGAAYVFQEQGGNWTNQYKLNSLSILTSFKFGTAVAMSAGDVIVGDPWSQFSGSSSGSAYIFKLSGVCSDSACESDPKCHGACCNGGSCTPDVWEPDCAGAGVTYQGPYSQCQGESTVDTCTDGYDDDCDGNTDCADDGCATLPACIRACCFATSSCLNLWVEDCTALGGLPGAVGSTCAATQCFPTGACCLGTGGCQNGVSPTACQNGGGSYLGFASTCQNFESGAKCHDGLDNDCDGAADCADSDCSTGPSCTGACCYPLGSCTEGISDDFCTTGGGTYQGNGTSCSGVSCPQPEGACCTTSGGCAELIGMDCQVVPNSAWAGPFTTCLDSFPAQELSGSTCCDNFDNDCDGAADLDDDDCTGVVCSAELRVAPIPHDVPKNRYISFTAEDKQTPTAIKVTRTAPPFGDVGWVGVPDSRGLAGLKASPVMRVWTDMAVHVGDCAIIPNATYELRTTTDGGVFSQPFVVSTVAKPAGKDWGDTVGVLAQGAWTPPNGFANVQDVVAVLHNIQALPGAPHASVVDLQAISTSDPCLNRIVNTADVLIEVRAVAGNAYPFTANPAACTPCP